MRNWAGVLGCYEDGMHSSASFRFCYLSPSVCWNLCVFVDYDDFHCNGFAVPRAQGSYRSDQILAMEAVFLPIE